MRRKHFSYDNRSRNGIVLPFLMTQGHKKQGSPVYSITTLNLISHQSKNITRPTQYLPLLITLQKLHIYQIWIFYNGICGEKKCMDRKKIIRINPLNRSSFGSSFQGSCVSILCHARTLHVTLFVDYVITPRGFALRDVNAEVLLCTCSRWERMF